MEFPDEDVRLVESSLRSSVYVSRHGNLYRRYEDTGTWEQIQPRMDDDGIVRALSNKSITQLIAEGWLGKPSYKARCPGVVCKADHDPHDASNLRWPAGVDTVTYRGERETANAKMLSKRPYEIYLLINDRTVDGFEDLANHLKVAMTTVYTYVSQLLTKFPDVDTALVVMEWLHEGCLRACQRVSCNGSLSDVMVLVDDYLQGDASWHDSEFKYAELRVARICCDVLS
jgi:hypothetical protein